MKKYFSYLFLGILIFTLLSCGGSEDSSEVEELQKQVDELQSQLDNSDSPNKDTDNLQKKVDPENSLPNTDSNNPEAFTLQGTIVEDSKYDPFFRYIDVQNLRISY